jgi:TolB protein
MSSDGTDWQQITFDLSDELHPVWSPDGARLAFVSDRDGDWEIYVINVNGTGLRQLTHNDDWDSYPDWSPDGAQLAFTSRRDGNYDLYLVDLSSGALQRLTTSPYTDAHPSWAPGGQEIAYTMVVADGNSLRREIGILDLRNPSHPRRTLFSLQGSAMSSFPDWSLDGRWIVYTSEESGNQDIYLAPVSGELTVNLTDGSLASDFGPGWSP